MKNPYERMRKRIAAAERAKAGGKPRDRVSRKPLSAASAGACRDAPAGACCGDVGADGRCRALARDRRIDARN